MSSQPGFRLSVVIPAYNEEPNIKPLLDQFNDVINRAGADWEVLLVNDGSTDKTLERARDAARARRTSQSDFREKIAIWLRGGDTALRPLLRP